MRTDPRLLRSLPAPERTAAAVPAVDGVPARPSRLPAELGCASQDHLVLRRNERCLADCDLLLDGAQIRVPGLAGQIFDAVVARPVVPDPGRRREARHPVDQRPSADRGSGEHRHRPIPGREEAMVQVEPPVPIELVGRHRRLVDQRPRLEDDDGASGSGQLGSDDAAARPRADDHRIRLHLHRLVRRARLERRPSGPDLGGLFRDRTGLRDVAHCAESRVRALRRPDRRRRGRSAASGSPGRPIGEAGCGSLPTSGDNARVSPATWSGTSERAGSIARSPAATR